MYQQKSTINKMFMNNVTDWRIHYRKLSGKQYQYTKLLSTATMHCTITNF